MKTLSITEGRKRLGYWLEKAVRGEDVGFAFKGKIVALRPIDVHSGDYAFQEYGLTGPELEKAYQGITHEVEQARHDRKLRSGIPARRNRPHRPL